MFIEDMLVQYKTKELANKFIFLYRTPSELVGFNNINYEMVIMPPCSEILSRGQTTCTYELMSLNMYFSKKINTVPDVVGALQNIAFSTDHITNMLFSVMQQATKYENEFGSVNKTSVYNKVACEWINENRDISLAWVKQYSQKQQIIIGGLFPDNATYGKKTNLKTKN